MDGKPKQEQDGWDHRDVDPNGRDVTIQQNPGIMALAVDDFIEQNYPNMEVHPLRAHLLGDIDQNKYDNEVERNLVPGLNRFSQPGERYVAPDQIEALLCGGVFERTLQDPPSSVLSHTNSVKWRLYFDKMHSLTHPELPHEQFKWPIMCAFRQMTRLEVKMLASNSSVHPLKGDQVISLIQATQYLLQGRVFRCGTVYPPNLFVIGLYFVSEGVFGPKETWDDLASKLYTGLVRFLPDVYDGDTRHLVYWPHTREPLTGAGVHPRVTIDSNVWLKF